VAGDRSCYSSTYRMKRKYCVARLDGYSDIDAKDNADRYQHACGISYLLIKVFS
jgi:hypothetical protein